MEQKTNPDVYPIDVALFRDEQGVDRIYTKDPIHPENTGVDMKAFIQDLYVFMGRIPSRRNPILARVKLYKVDRTIEFRPDVLTRIEKQGDVHLMDKDGNIVSILPFLTNDPKFPYNGTVLNVDGYTIDTRTYAVDGQCSDEDPQHRLFVVAGPAPLKKRED